MGNLKVTVLTTKWTHKYLKTSNEQISKDIEYIRDKYNISEEDFVRFMIGMQILGTREYVERNFGGTNEKDNNTTK